MITCSQQFVIFIVFVSRRDVIYNVVRLGKGVIILVAYNDGFV
jgi:hypothetical protein